jgi:hypothetical protein
MDQAGYFENTQALPQRGKACSVSVTKRGLSPFSQAFFLFRAQSVAKINQAMEAMRKTSL